MLAAAHSNGDKNNNKDQHATIAATEKDKNKAELIR